jgi:hypothetical protein
VWLLLKKWPKEQLAQLFALYERCWGPCSEWTDEQLEWGVEIEKCLAQTRAEDADEPIASGALPLLLGATSQC